MSDTYQAQLESDPGMAEAMDAPPGTSVGMDEGPTNPVSSMLDAAGAAPLDMVDMQPGWNGEGVASPSSKPPDPAQLAKLQEEGMGLRREAIDMAKQQVAELDKARQNRPKPPELQKIPEAPQQKLGEGSMAFMQIAALLGALAGGRARSGATGALNAFAAAMQGFKSGQLEVFKQQSDQWKQHADQVISDNQEKLQQYKVIWEDDKMNLDQKMEEYKIVAGIYKDQINYNLADQRNYTLAAQNFQKDWMNTVRMAQATESLNKTRQQVIDKAQAAKDERDRIDQLAQGLKDNTVAPDQISFRDKNKVYAKALQNGVNVREKEQQWTIAKLEMRALNSTAMMRFVGLEKSIRPELDIIIDLSKQLKLNGLPDVNKADLELWNRTEPNSKRGKLAAQYLYATAQIQDAVAQLAKGGYAPTESAFKLADQMFNRGWSTGQMGAVAEKMSQVLDVRMRSIPGLATMGPDANNPFTGQTGGQPPAAAPTAPQTNDEVEAAKKRLGL